MSKSNTNINGRTPTSKTRVSSTVNGNESLMSRKRIYWLSQISGWLLFGIVNIVLYASFSELNWSRLLVSFYLCFTGVCLTHIYRSVIKKKDWLTLQLKQIIPRVLLGSVIIGVVIVVLIYAVYVFSGLNLETG